MLVSEVERVMVCEMDGRGMEVEGVRVDELRWARRDEHAMVTSMLVVQEHMSPDSCVCAMV